MKFELRSYSERKISVADASRTLVVVSQLGAFTIRQLHLLQNLILTSLWLGLFLEKLGKHLQFILLMIVAPVSYEAVRVEEADVIFRLVGAACVQRGQTGIEHCTFS